MGMICVRAGFKKRNSKKAHKFNVLNPKDFSHKEWTVWDYVKWAKKEFNRAIAFCPVGNMEF